MLADAPARARAFGVSSLLRLPFPSAVKTGTSSDYRDTWTVGFTRDYTVAVWVGNFNGAPMRRVSGVTGAAPLWNRIMLHLAETYGEPGRFDPPHGYARSAICATTGARPDPSCPALVTEWLDAGDRSALRSARPAPLPPLRIASPLDGAIYRPGGVILARAIGTTAILHWRVNGDPLGTGRVVPLTLRAGEYTLVADDGVHRATAHLSVEPKPVGPQRGGFTVR
jgi:penicillin-binding protein 1C